MFLQTSDDPSATFGRLISPVFDLEKTSHCCITLMYYVRKDSYGKTYSYK